MTLWRLARVTRQAAQLNSARKRPARYLEEPGCCSRFGRGGVLVGVRETVAMTAPEVITVWVCDECGYWRQEKSTGVHQTSDPNNWRGKMVTHSLREQVYIRGES